MDGDLQVIKILEFGLFRFRFEVFISHIDKPNVFHPTDSKLRNEHIVILWPWERSWEKFLVKLNCWLQQSKELTRIDVLNFGLPDRNPDRHFKRFVVIINNRVISRIHAVKIRTDRWRFFKDMASKLSHIFSRFHFKILLFHKFFGLFSDQLLLESSVTKDHPFCSWDNDL